MADKKWENFMAVWVKKGDNGDPFLSIKFEKPMSFQAGESITVSQNKFYDPEKNTPRFVLRKPVEETKSLDAKDSDIL